MPSEPSGPARAFIFSQLPVLVCVVRSGDDELESFQHGGCRFGGGFNNRKVTRGFVHKDHFMRVLAW